MWKESLRPGYPEKVEAPNPSDFGLDEWEAHMLNRLCQQQWAKDRDKDRLP